MEKKQDKIKNIIFDLGGVLLNIDYQKTVNAFKALGMPNPEQAFTKEIQAEFFQQFEKGLISEEVFIAEIKKQLKNVSSHDIVEAWCALLEDFPRERFEFLNSLSGKYRIFLLSNTNIIHLKAFQEIIESAVGWDAFISIFEGMGYSHELNMRKPNADIFKKMMIMYNLDPSETCFIDDTTEHVATAKSLGINAMHLPDKTDIRDLLKDF